MYAICTAFYSIEIMLIAHLGIKETIQLTLTFPLNANKLLSNYERIWWILKASGVTLCREMLGDLLLWTSDLSYLFAKIFQSKYFLFRRQFLRKKKFMDQWNHNKKRYHYPPNVTVMNRQSVIRILHSILLTTQWQKQTILLIRTWDFCWSGWTLIFFRNWD